jgi:hypothetical protein
MATQKDYDHLGAWALIKNPDQNIDRRGAKRVVPMEVLSLGLHRTGTLSMQEAYSILGYQNPYHYASLVSNVKDADMWNEALRAKYSGKGRPYGRAEFDQLLGHCGAVTDTPICNFWKELIEAYPEAKVVLVERDEEKWLRSWAVLIRGVFNPFGQYVLRFTDPYWFGRILTCGRWWAGGMYGSVTFEGAQKNAAAVYRAHYRDIRAAVPKDRLLNYQLGSGWEPLCKFLGKEVPDVPFPHRNEAEVLENAFGALFAKALRRSALNIAVVVGAIAGLYWLLL